jgi:uncharacterized protein with HEPN domain
MNVSRENDLERFRHMLEAVEKAQAFGEGHTRDDLAQDEMRLLAIARLLGILGEAASKITPERRAEYPELPWAEMTGMRNHLIHGYFAVDLDIVWDTLHSNLPKLSDQLKEFIAMLEVEPPAQ